jgi:single-stranded DNA-binding protein
MSNATNNANLIGRLASDPKRFDNADGSKKVLITLYVDRAYRGQDNKTISDQISLEAFISSTVDGLGPFGNVHAGDQVAVASHIEQMPYVDKKTNKLVYPTPKVVIDNIRFLESRTTTQARVAARAADSSAPAAAQAGESADYEADAPFAAAQA